MQHKMTAPSVLSADFGNLQRDIEMLNRSAADWFHVDIMDGVFVPNISFGFPVMEVLKKHATKPLDVHMMIQNPTQYVKAFADAGAYMITIHAEAEVHLHRAIHHIHECGAKAGVAINPHTPVSILEDVIQDLDLVLLMSVNPGFGGQKFIQRTYTKLQKLVELREKSGSTALIEVDGGVNNENAPLLYAGGADVLVAGNYVFKSPNPEEAILSLTR
jgi:ribulose-phosphate 3-epimerase